MNQWIARCHIPVDYEVLEESALAQAQSAIQNAIISANISQSDLARRMKCNRSVISRIMSGNHNLTIKTMARAMAASGYEVRFELVPIKWNWVSDAKPKHEEKLTAHAVSTVSSLRAA